MKKRLKKVLYGEVGVFFTDVAKYVTTGVIITTLLNDFGKETIIVYAVGISAIVIFFGLGLWFIKIKEE